MSHIRIEGRVTYVEHTQPVHRVHVSPFLNGDIAHMIVDVYDTPTVVGIVSPDSFLAQPFEYYGSSPNVGSQVRALHLSQGWGGLHCHRYAFFQESHPTNDEISGVYFPISDTLVGHIAKEDVQKIIPTYVDSEKHNPFDVSATLRSYIDVILENCH